MSQSLQPKPLSTVNLADFDPDYHGDYDKETAKAEEGKLEERLFVLQEKLYAQSEQALLVVFQAMDTGGKDGAIKKVFHGVNPQGVLVTSFKSPSTIERAHDFLWRIHQHTPAKGMIGIFNRSHYEEVLIVRVDELVPKKVWQARYDHINHFEQMLTDSGTRVIKFYFHISKDEQKERLENRLKDPEKNWKFASGDLETRAKWDEYMRAYEALLTHCNTEYAPWYIIPANRKWYRDLVVTRIMVETLESMNLAFPPPEPGLDKIVIPD